MLYPVLFLNYVSLFYLSNLDELLNKKYNLLGLLYATFDIVIVPKIVGPNILAFQAVRCRLSALDITQQIW